MMETPAIQNKEKVKNSKLSVWLIILNLILAFILSLTVPNPGESKYVWSLIMVLLVAIVSLAIYSFSYHGEGYNWGKWLLGFTIIVAVITFFILLNLFVT